MVKKVNIPLPIQWHEGLLLYPQHFQQQRRVIQDTLAAGLCAAHPFFWGVFHYSIDQKALKAGVLQVDDLQAIMPDGLPVAVQPSAPLRLSLEDAEKALSGKKQIVHLCLPLEHANAANPQDNLARYREVCEADHNHPDENTGENSVAVPRLLPQLSLIIGHVPAHYTSIPLCEIFFTEGTFSLTDFYPPTCRLNPEGSLHTVLKKKLDVLHDRIIYFVERLQAPLSYESNSLQEKYTQIYSVLMRPFFILNALAHQRETHPYTLFLELCRTCGDFASVVPGRMPLEIPSYNHLDPLTSLTQALNTLHEYIIMIEKPSLSVPFIEEGGLFYLHLDEKWLKGSSIVLSIHPDTIDSINSTKAWIEGAMIISKSLVPRSQSLRILGAERSFIDNDTKTGLVATPQKLLLQVSLDNASVRPNEELCILHLSKAFKPPKAIYICIEDKD